MVLQAINPMHALQFTSGPPWRRLLAAVGCVPGHDGWEALYADMGHFGAKLFAWAGMDLVFPCLIFELLWPKALVLRDASAAANPSSCWHRSGS